jgi:hypothetical protein
MNSTFVYRRNICEQNLKKEIYEIMFEFGIFDFFVVVDRGWGGVNIFF